MLKAACEKLEGVTVYHLLGTIDETADFEKLFTVQPELTFNCRKVDRINSAGVRSWLKYFRSLHHNGIKFKFVECSPAIVEQLNVIKNFQCNGEVSSIYLPFACLPCKTQFVQLIPVSRLKTIYQKLPIPNCPKCGQPAIFDEIENEYFAFLAA